MSATVSRAQRLFHVSEMPDLRVFLPRSSPEWSGSLVWAVDIHHLPNYLLPRECPRVCFRRVASSSSDDVRSLIGSRGHTHVIVIEAGWLDICAKAELTVYEFDGASFVVRDEDAGYFVSRGAVVPKHRWSIRRPLDELERRGVEVRETDDLWQIRDRIVSSTLQFSCIRMRNARNRGGSGPDARDSHGID